MKIKPDTCDSSACVEVEWVDEGVVLVTNPRYPGLAVPFTRKEAKEFIESAKLGQYDLD